MKNKEVIFELMKSKGLDAVMLWSSAEIFSVTGLVVNDACLLIVNSKLVLITPEGSGISREENLEVYEYKEYGFEKRENPVANIMSVLKRFIAKDKKLGVTNDKKAFQIYTQLLECEQIDISAEIEELMLCKEEPLHAGILKTVGLNDLAFEEIRGNLKAGMTEFEIRAIVEGVYHRETGKLVKSGGDYLTGERTAEISGGPTNRKLKAGEPLIVDIQVTYDGAAVDTTRVFFIGEPKPEVSKSYEAVKNALKAAEDILKPGVKGKDVYNAICSILERNGEKPLPHHAGHGVGFRWYEPPYFIPSSEQELKEGMIVAVEPGVYHENYGIRLENNFLITKDGCKNLTNSPTNIEWAIV